MKMKQNKSTKVDFSTSAAITQNTCYALVADFLAVNFNRSKVFLFFFMGVVKIFLLNSLYIQNKYLSLHSNLKTI